MTPRSNGEKLLDCCAAAVFGILIIVILWLLLGCAPLAIVPAVTTETPATVTTETMTPLPSPTVSPVKCAIVTANTALNLRDAPGIHGRVIGYLYHGDVLQVVSYDQSDPVFAGHSLSAWWKVRTAEGVEGWSRSTFLNPIICEQENKP